VTEEPDSVAAFERYVLGRRAWMGILSIGAGVGMLLLGGVLALQTMRHSFGGQPPLHAMVALLLLGVGAIVIAFKLFRGGYIDDAGNWVEQPRVPWRMVLVRGGIAALVVTALVGWPLGLFKLPPPVSMCRELLPVDELSAIVHQPLDARLHGNHLECYALYEPSEGREIADLTVRHTNLYDGWIDNQLSRERDNHPPDSPLDVGEHGVIIHRGTATIIAFTHGGHGAKLTLGSAFHDAEVAQVLAALRKHLGALE
jgi:hypothetical protein